MAARSGSSGGAGRERARRPELYGGWKSVTLSNISVSIQFTHPEWLWVGLPVLGWLLWLDRTSGVQSGPVRRWLALSTRLLVAGAMVLALAGLQWRTPVEGMNLFFVLDRSDSVSPAQQEAARAWLGAVAADKKPNDRAGLIVFGADAGIAASTSASFAVPKDESVVQTEKTDIGGALTLAAAAFPEHGQRRIVLISDGNENAGDARRAAASARALGVNVDVVPLRGARQRDVAIQRLQLPATVKSGRIFDAKVFVRADAPGPATVRLYRDERFLGEQTVRLEAGKNLLSFPQSLPASGFYSYEIQVDAAQDFVPQNNRAFGFTRVRGIPRVLLVSSELAADAPLAAALDSPELELRVVGVGAFPGSLAELQSYDTILFGNVAAWDLARDQLGLLETAVRDFGVGFVCIGGDQAYAAGAYRGTPLASILPVEVELSGKKVLPPGALMLVIDQSGSMTGEKLLMAKQAAVGAVEALAPGDYVGVIAFSGAPHLVADIQPARNREAIIRGIMEVDSAGGTVMCPAMTRAHEMLRGVTASFKHCIILTDGVSAPGDFEAVTRGMAADRITVSTVGVGKGADAALLQAIADNGRGRFYAVEFPYELLQIFIKETAVVLKSAIQEEPFTPRLAAATELVRGVAAGGYPPLLGYVATESRPRAETPLVTDKGDPLLAQWQCGLGRAVAFTSDARAKWARNWIAWDQYRPFWRQIVRWSLRRLDDANLDITVAADRQGGRMVVDALDEKGNFRNHLDLRGTVVSPKGGRQTVSLRQTAPGHYEAAFPMRETGVYLLNLLQMENGQARAAQTVGASLNYSPEFEASAPNVSLLRQIAETTGGKVLDPSLPGSNPFYDNRRKTWQPRDLWETLLKLVVLTFVLDVGIRRLNPDPEQLRQAWCWLRSVALFWRPAPAAASAAEASLAALLARRGDVRSRLDARPAAFPAPGPLPDALPGTTPAASPGGYRGSASPEPDPAAATDPSLPGSEPSTTSRLLEAKRRARQRKA